MSVVLLLEQQPDEDIGNMDGGGARRAADRQGHVDGRGGRNGTTNDDRTAGIIIIIDSRRPRRLPYTARSSQDEANNIDPRDG